MNKFRLYLKNHPKLRKAIFLMYIVLIWGLSFPFELNFWKAYLLIVVLLVVGSELVDIFGINNDLFVYIIGLILTGLGLIFRYFFEYGEVSNRINFTTFNIISYLVAIPILTLVSYRFFARSVSKKI